MDDRPRPTRLAALLALALAAVLVAGLPGSGPLATQSSLAHEGGGRHCPRGDQHGFHARGLLGKPVRRAARIARRRGCTIRVVRRNGEGLVVTDDFVPTRINVGVWHRRVTSVRGVF